MIAIVDLNHQNALLALELWTLVSRVAAAVRSHHLSTHALLLAEVRLPVAHRSELRLPLDGLGL